MAGYRAPPGHRIERREKESSQIGAEKVFYAFASGERESRERAYGSTLKLYFKTIINYRGESTSNASFYPQRPFTNGLYRSVTSGSFKSLQIVKQQIRVSSKIAAVEIKDARFAQPLFISETSRRYSEL